MTPTVTLLLLSYNSEATIHEALDSALRQNYPALEIVVSDDCSCDDTFALIDAAISHYRGPHRVRAIRNARNLGVVGNIEAGASHASGDLLVLAAGDDRSHPDRVSRIAEAWFASGEPSACVVYSDVAPVDAKGRLVENWPERVARPPWSLARLADAETGPLGAGCAITKRLLTEPDKISSFVRHEDRVLPFRALLLGGVILFVDEKLVSYRVEGGMSRYLSGDRNAELTRNMRSRLLRTIPDAHQRLADSIVAAAPKNIIMRCRQVIAEQEGMLGMAEGNQLFLRTKTAIRAGARPYRMLWHLARFVRTRLFYR